jgi:hypothetical protein
MPFVLLEGYRFGFFSLDRGEPPHVHVFRGENEAKIWLEPVEVEWNYGFNRRDLNRVLELTRENQAKLLEMWHEHFSQ